MLKLRFTKILGFLSLIVTFLNMKMYSRTLSWGSGLLITTQFFKTFKLLFTILEQCETYYIRTVYVYVIQGRK